LPFLVRVRHNETRMRAIRESVFPRLVVVILAAAVFFCSSAFGASGGQDEIEQAESAFAGLDFEGALTQLDVAEARPGNSRAQLVRIFSLRGLCLISLGREQEAGRAFGAALSIDPGFRLDPDLSPRYQEPFDKLLDSGVAPLSVDVSLPEKVVFGDPVPVKVKLLADPAGLSGKLVFRHRRAGVKKYSTVRIRLTPGKPVSFYLPPGTWAVKGTAPVEWYAKLTDKHGGMLLEKGAADHPLRVPVEARKKVKLSTAGPIGTPAPVVESAPAWYERWWVWAIIGGAAVAAGGTAAAIYLTRSSPEQRDFVLQIE